MKILVSALLLTVWTVSAAVADNQQSGGSCKDMLDRVMKATGAQLDGSSSDDFFTLKADAVSGASLRCGNGKRFDFSARSSEPDPSDAYFKFLGAAGSALSGEAPKTIEAGLRRCQQGVRKIQNPNSEEGAQFPVEISSKIMAVCTAGDGTQIDVIPPD